MNRVDAHFEHEILIPTFKDIQIDSEGNRYRVLNLNDSLTVFTTEFQAEDVFRVLDEGLHYETYSDLQDKLFNLQDDFDELVAQNTRLLEKAVNE